MAAKGWRVRVAVRRPDEALFVRTYGVVGQVEPVRCNIRDDASVAEAATGADAVVNCVGVLAPQGKNTFEATQADGAARVARMAKAAGVARLVHISAIGADTASDSDYAKTKAAGEAAVRDQIPEAVILRPSIVFGPEDQFFNRFAGMARLGPILPVVGANTRFQPVHVEDVAHAAEMGVLGTAAPGIYELGGPDVATFKDLMTDMLRIIRRRRLIVNTPFPIARTMGWGFDLMTRLTGGLLPGPLTLDQVKNLARDNVVTGRVKTFEDLGIRPTSMEAVLPDYLWRFRPDGQYAELKESARSLDG